MKKLLLFMTTLGLALAAPAQAQPQPARSQNLALDDSQTYPVASPNRTRAAELDFRAKRDKHNHHSGHPKVKVEPDALVWVDANGQPAGRFSSDNAMVVHYNDQLALLLGLTSVRCTSPDSTGQCTYLGGARWGEPQQIKISFTTFDCSGPSYLPSSTPATPYLGIPVLDGDRTYLYLAKVSDAVEVILRTTFFNNRCEALERQFPVIAYPTHAVIPASAIGMEPFTVK
jgi:hypothetical protein